MSSAEKTPFVTREQEDLMLEAARLHHVPDWERLMEDCITPTLAIGGERRLHRASRAATTRQPPGDAVSTSHATP